MSEKYTARQVLEAFIETRYADLYGMEPGPDRFEDMLKQTLDELRGCSALSAKEREQEVWDDHARKVN